MQSESEVVPPKFRGAGNKTHKCALPNTNTHSHRLWDTQHGAHVRVLVTWMCGKVQLLGSTPLWLSAPRSPLPSLTELLVLLALFGPVRPTSIQSEQTNFLCKLNGSQVCEVRDTFAANAFKNNPQRHTHRHRHRFHGHIDIGEHTEKCVRICSGWICVIVTGRGGEWEVGGGKWQCKDLQCGRLRSLLGNIIYFSF